MLSVKKVLAGRGAVDYYLAQIRHGLANYYLPDAPDPGGDNAEDPRRLSAPGTSWWGGSAAELELDGEIERRDFVPLYAKGVRPGGGYLGSKFRLPEQAAAARDEAMRRVDEHDDPYERWMARHEARRKGGHASVAAWDCTFSPVKSVSLLWAAGKRHVQEQVWAAHTAAVDAGLEYLEEHAAYVRAGRNGVRVLDTDGLVVARMNEWTSRDGDMQIHTHCLVLNRARTSEDGKWRALDGRALLKARTGAGALYNRVLEAELTRRLGVAWRDRPDGLRELEGVDDELIEAFSTRRRAITARLAEMVEAYRDKYGHEPPPAVVSSMAQDATLKTRKNKLEIRPSEALERWEATARDRGRKLSRLPRRVLGRVTSDGQDAGWPEAIERAVLARLEDGGRATFTRHDLLRAALDVIPTAGLTTEELRARAEGLVDLLIARPELLSTTAPDVITAPDDLRRRDGSSVYRQPNPQRWTLAATIDREAWLLDVAGESDSPSASLDVVEHACRRHELGSDQTQAVAELLTDDRRIGLLIGPAGAGKTRTLRAAVDAWRDTGREVLGLTVSQAAAQVLSAEAQVRGENTAKWLFETDRGRWKLPDGALVLIDEASMVSTTDLVALVDQTRQAGGKVLLIGDPAQLAAIHVGGAFDLLVEHHSASRLHEVRRFTDPWEADASLKLRSRDPAALAEYAMRGRIHGGRLADVETHLFEAWRADAFGRTRDGSRQAVLMIVSTNEQAAVLGERARHALLEHGAVDNGPTVRLRDNAASAGDHIVTRRNDRRLRTSTRGWVINGDVWTILEVHNDGAASARRQADGATVTLPADYLAEHCHLAYATTAHRAQGMTVDICHAAVTADASHEQLYVAGTRGRQANHLWVVVDSDRDLVRDDQDLPAPEELLSKILERRDPDRLSAHQVIADAQNETTSLARLGAIFEDAARTATDHWLAGLVSARGLADATGDSEWSSVVTRVRQAALAGYDIEALVDDALCMRPLSDAHSASAVLHWRLGVLTDDVTAVRHRGPLRSLPPGHTADIDIARQAGELIRQRWRNIRADLAQTREQLTDAPELGPRPDDPSGASAWLTAATPVIAYRERYEVADHIPMLGPRPAATRPDAQAAWDHARLAADRYLALRLRRLDTDELEQLDTRMEARIRARPRFDPEELTAARQTLEEANRAGWTASGPTWSNADAVRGASHQVSRLERAAEAHREWRRLTAEAKDIRRHIALEHSRRHTSKSVMTTARGR